MFAGFDDPSFVDDQNLVRLTDGAQTVCDHKAGTALHQREQRLLDLHFSSGVHTAGSLIQDQDARVGQDGACDRQKLALSLAQIAGPFGKFCLVALRKTSDKAVCIGQFRGRHDFVIGSVKRP